MSDHADFAGWVVFVSFIVFVGGMILVPWLIVRLPADYFIAPRRSYTDTLWRHPIFRWIALIAKNLFGVILLILGIAMLVLPGQGLLTIAVAIFLLDFPGKRKLERKLIERKAILNSANWLRKRAGVAPLVVTRPRANG
ncbi:PGPGW domain-containing protein [Stieleria sp. JC731]|uniref:PGPGW domain-containing protein n=1 Tax=Stieleria sp. JC731 TaxID=2894195 RepID=UPI001E29F4AE|nr:PGPGW domain-containing protein [Stieleria sp. JC731]